MTRLAIITCTSTVQYFFHCVHYFRWARTFPILWDSKLEERVPKSSLLNHILSQLNRIHTLIPHLWPVFSLVSLFWKKKKNEAYEITLFSVYPSASSSVCLSPLPFLRGLWDHLVFCVPVCLSISLFISPKFSTWLMKSLCFLSIRLPVHLSVYPPYLFYEVYEIALFSVYPSVCLSPLNFLRGLWNHFVFCVSVCLFICLFILLLLLRGLWDHLIFCVPVCLSIRCLSPLNFLRGLWNHFFLCIRLSVHLSVYPHYF
jgi:hypothetical protein